MSAIDTASAEKNISLYPWYVMGQGAYFWMPIFFLFFSGKVSVAEVLWLEVIYYSAVVLLEVPSGYASDRIGRRFAMLLSGASLIIAHLLFFFASNFALLAVAQVALAAGIAMDSGTGTSFHFDSLKACNKETEYGAREAKLAQYSLWTSATAALIGGALGAFSLRGAYALSAIAGLVVLWSAWRFVEPPTELPTEPPTGLPTEPLKEPSSQIKENKESRIEAPNSPEFNSFKEQVIECLGEIRRQPLSWLFGCAVLATVLNHLPYEFYQPYLSLSTSPLSSPLSASFSASLSISPISLPWGGDLAPLLSGLHMATALGIAGWAGRRSVAWSHALGLRPFLLLSLVIQWGLVTLMALWLHPLIALALVLRGFPRAMLQAPLREAIVPRLSPSIRATYLSIQSLAGRLSYAGLLVLLSLLIGGQTTLDWSALSTLLLWSSGITGVGILGLWSWRRRGGAGDGLEDEV